MGREELWEFAERHHGIVRTDEQREAGIAWRERDSIEFIRLSPRVARRAGAPQSDHQRALAAALDAGKGVALAGHSGGWLWRVPGFALGDPPELARERGVATIRREPLGIINERRSLPAHHVTQVDAIPVLTLPVLLYQLAATVPPARFERVADTIVGRSPGVLRAMHGLLPELGQRGRNGITVVRAYLEERPLGERVPTGLERRFEHVVEEGGERPLARQVDLGGHEWIGRVDYVDRDILLIVEVQSSTYHDSLLDRRADAARAMDLLAAGFRGVLQVSEDVVWYRPSDLVAAVRDARRVLMGRSVTSITRAGVRFEVTERGWGGGEGRMSA